MRASSCRMSGLFSYYQFDNWAYQPSVRLFEYSVVLQWSARSNIPQRTFEDRALVCKRLAVLRAFQQPAWYRNADSISAEWMAFGSRQSVHVGGRCPEHARPCAHHTDDSIQIKYYDKPERFLDKAAFSLTGDMGCEHGGGVSCAGNSAKGPKQSFLGYMLYNRLWFDNDRYGLTIGGGQINNPGRYLVLLPPINGATAISGTPYFTENPGDPYKAWDVSGTFDWMPSQYITFRWEYNHRAANVPYFSGSGGVTPPGGNQGTAGSFVCLSGFTTCNGSPTNTWFPDLRKTENRATIAILVKF